MALMAWCSAGTEYPLRSPNYATRIVAVVAVCHPRHDFQELALVVLGQIDRFMEGYFDAGDFACHVRTAHVSHAASETIRAIG